MYRSLDFNGREQFHLDLKEKKINYMKKDLEKNFSFKPFTLNKYKQKKQLNVSKLSSAASAITLTNRNIETQ